MPKSIYNGAGYLLADNRASDWGTKDEDDLVGCGHCGATIRKHGYTDRQGKYHPGYLEEGGWCVGCGKPLCGPENCNCRDKAMRPVEQGGGCVAMEREIEKALKEHHRKEQNSKVRGL